MGISLLSLGALGLVLYFGWALADPQTLKEVEDQVARSSSSTAEGWMPLWVRNCLGLVICLVLLGSSLYRDLKPEASRLDQPERPVARTLPPPTIHDKSLVDRIDGATLQRQIERQQAESRAAGL
ncbi:MAG TPA: hypothetical protein VHV55_20550 [Pirellulales bacterium]|jgi:hypothetical protein|nr:hypothetical protein [Pirellulales bacterium]